MAQILPALMLIVPKLSRLRGDKEQPVYNMVIKISMSKRRKTKASTAHSSITTKLID
jgi:hypothetical protein